MAIKKYVVAVSRHYMIEIDENASDEFVKLEALSMFNHELQFGLITADIDDFNLEIIGDND